MAKIDNIERFILNISSISASTYYSMAKAKKLYVSEHSECAICGYKKKLNVHHIIPIHIDETLSCDPDNFITLCRDCHFTFGHFHNFRKYWNPDIREFAKRINSNYCTIYFRFREKYSINSIV